MSPVAIVLLVAAAVLVVATEWPRVAHRTPRLAARGSHRGSQGWRSRRRSRKRPKLEIVHPEHEEFVRSIERDLASLPTIDEHDVKRH